MSREQMSFDIVIVGAGPSGLSAACRLIQQAKEHKKTLSVCILEKAAEVGGHIVSGAILEPSALNMLFPNWKTLDSPVKTQVKKDLVYYFFEHNAFKIPSYLHLKSLNNRGNYIISLSKFCRWLAAQAEQLGVEIFSGYTAQKVIIENNQVKGIITGDMGRDKNNDKKQGFAEGIEIRARYTLLAEGARGHLGKKIIKHFNLDAKRDPQHYALGIKEVWEIEPSSHSEGLVIHSTGWPLSATKTNGGGFLYHFEDNLISVGLITDLNYTNTYLNPFEEFQRFKHHPTIRHHLQKATRKSYAARAIAKGGVQSLVKMNFPGGMLIGCNAGTLNFSKIKGIHTAMHSGILAAEFISKQMMINPEQSENHQPTFTIKHSQLYRELHQQRNVAPMLSKYGPIMGGVMAWLDFNLFLGKLPWTLNNKYADYKTTLNKIHCLAPQYKKPDGKISFDKLSSVYLSHISHDENQPCHLILKNQEIPIQYNLKHYDEPAQRYCPAGVYEIISENYSSKLQINPSNCIHCKTCDIKDPIQNITWIAPEGGSGPNYTDT